MNQLEVLLEEPSAKALLEALFANLNPTVEANFHVFDGKSNLLRKLPNRLKGYSYYPTPPRILVLVDRDDDDCQVLKETLERMSEDAGLPTKSKPAACGNFMVCNRIAVEELEAWILGDAGALRSAFPRLGRFEDRASYRDPDSVQGGTWEALERLLMKARYYPGGLQKIDCATRVGKHLAPDRNRSRSFAEFLAGVKALVDA